MSELITNIWTQFDTKTEEKWKDLVKKLEQSCTGLDISAVERDQIVQAMGLGAGHWYKCPNGHVYAIGECGGAMEVGHSINTECPQISYMFITIGESLS